MFLVPFIDLRGDLSGAARIVQETKKPIAQRADDLWVNEGTQARMAGAEGALSPQSVPS